MLVSATQDAFLRYKTRFGDTTMCTIIVQVSLVPDSLFSSPVRTPCKMQRSTEYCLTSTGHVFTGSLQPVLYFTIAGLLSANEPYTY
mmetsp:Transcript_12999/g.18857  ORF Transcript_12999/g.18857 Transcript_12999/m.18857 type:complete len:87 (+) Transcript_12999:416-676(+)